MPHELDDVTRDCPVCEHPGVTPFLTRPSVPVHQNLLLPSADEARRLARGSLAAGCCERCGFVFNLEFDGSLLRYGEAYDNTQDLSPSFARHIDALIGRLVDRHGVRGKRVVEVGCGKGTFLTRLVERAGAGTSGTGFDPAYVGDLERNEGALRFERRFYDEHAADVPADLVVCRHVIEHVPSPVDLLRSVRRALGDNTGARVFFETPCVRWILEHRVVWDFFYEHCSLFTAESLSTAFERAGFVVESVDHVFGGQYLFLEARPAAQPVAPACRANGIPELARRYSESERTLIESWSRFVDARETGRVPFIWGAGAKGVTFANLVDADCESFRGIIDINPGKQGRFLPGTGHPIVPPDALRSAERPVVLVLNPNYVAEIQAAVVARNGAGDVIDLMKAA